MSNIVTRSKKCFRIVIPLITTMSIQAKILIITHQFDRPMFIEMQYRTFQKFLLNENNEPDQDFEYVVFNDSNNPILCSQIESACAKCAVSCIRVPQELHNQPFPHLPASHNKPQTSASLRHATAIRYSLETLGFNHNDIMILIDCDMVLIRPFNIRQYMQDQVIASAFRRMHSINFLWPGLVFINMPLLPDKKRLNFNPYGVHGNVLDTGGATYLYLNKHRDLAIKPIYLLWGDQLFCPHDHDRINPYQITLQETVNMNLEKDQQIALLHLWGYSDHEIELLQKKPANIEFF